MAWFEVDIFKSCVEIDLHDYSHKTTLEVARKKIKEAYEHGFRYIKLIHGSANIRDKHDGGSIKFALRSMLKRGELSMWAQDKESGNHKIMDESIILALRSNPAPKDREWENMPLCEY